MKRLPLKIDFSLRAPTEYPGWLGLTERRPYSFHGSHLHVLFLSRVLLFLGAGALGILTVTVLIIWNVRFRPLNAGISPWRVASLQFLPQSRIGVSAELTTLALARSSAGKVWSAHDLLVRALELDPANLPARMDLARHLEQEGFRPRALNLLEAGFAEGRPDAAFLEYAADRFSAAGDANLVIRLLAPAFANLPENTPAATRRILARSIVQAYLDQGRHAEAIAFARTAGFEGDETMGATRLRTRELLDRGRFAEAARLIGDLSGQGRPAPATALLFIEAAAGRGDIGGALEVARNLAEERLSLDERIALLQQVRRLMLQLAERNQSLAAVREKDASGITPAEVATKLYRQIVDAALAGDPPLATISRVAATLGDGPDSATLRDLASRYQADALRNRVWTSALVDALMLEGEARAALQLYLDQLGGKMQQSDDSGSAVQSALLYYLNFSNAPLAGELGRILAQQGASAGLYIRTVRILLRNRRWEGAQHIAALGLGLFPGNRELNSQATQAAQALSRKTSQESLTAGAATVAFAPLDRAATLQQAESYLEARNGHAVLSLLEQVERQRPGWTSEETEGLAWLRIRALTLSGHPLLVAVAAGDYVGTDPSRARRLHEWVATRIGEAASAGWLNPVSQLLRQRFPELPALGRWRTPSAGGTTSIAELISESDRLLATGDLAQAASLLDQLATDPGLPEERRGDVLQRKVQIAAALGRTGEVTVLVGSLLRQEPQRYRSLLVLAEQQARSAQAMARAIDKFAPGESAKSTLLAVLQSTDTGTPPAETSAPPPTQELEQVIRLLSNAQYPEAQELYQQYSARHPDLPPEFKELHDILGLAFQLSALQPEQARLAAQTICAYEPSGPALARALLQHHRIAQNHTAIQALQTALQPLHENH